MAKQGSDRSDYHIDIIGGEIILQSKIISNSFRLPDLKRYLSPGSLASFLCLMVICLWTFWGVSEMFHEGWYAPFEWLFFLLPAAVCLALTLVALTWPRLGGWLLIIIGVGFYGWAMWTVSARVGLTLSTLLSWLPVSGFLAVIGILFIVSARQATPTPVPTDPRWWRRHLRYLIIIGLPLLLGLGLAVEPAVRMASRVDDGNYGARLIVSDEAALVWAPAGPGWQESVTWNEIALYGVSPIGFEGKAAGPAGLCSSESRSGCAIQEEMNLFNVCLYLNNEGTQLENTPQKFWRMPTTSELVSSLVRSGKPAGCRWNGETGRQPCAARPDKETPLWRPDSPTIYLWSADEANSSEAYYVTYSGSVYLNLKYTGLGSRGFRCVRE